MKAPEMVAQIYQGVLKNNMSKSWESVAIGKVTEDEVELIITVRRGSFYNHTLKASEVLAEPYLEQGILPLIVIRHAPITQR